MPEGVTRLPAHVFHGATYLRHVKLPSTLNSIANSAFEGCKGLPNIYLPGSVSQIGAYTFRDCDGLIDFTVPGRVTSLENCVLADCDNLVSVTVLDQVTAISDEAFRNDPVTLSVIENTYPVTWAIDHDVPFVYVNYRDTDYSNYVLDMEATSFYTDSSVVLLNNYIPINLNYKMKEGLKDQLSNTVFRIRIPSSMQLINNSVVRDGIAVTDSTMENRILTIPVTKDEGTIQMSVRPIASGNLSTFASFEYKKDSVKKADIIGSFTLNVPLMTINAPAETSKNSITVSGLTEASKRVIIYLDGERTDGETWSRKNGSYSKVITLPEAVHKKLHTIRAELAEDSSVYATATVRYNVAKPELVAFDMYYTAHAPMHLDMMKAAGKRLNISFLPGTSFTFKVKFNNSDNIDELYVVSRKIKGTKKIAAVPTANKGEFIATGFFDEKNRNYVPGEINLWYSLNNSDEYYSGLTYDVPMESELPEYWQGATATVDEQTEKHVVQTVTLKDGTQIQIESNEYTKEEAYRIFLGEEPSQAPSRKLFAAKAAADLFKKVLEGLVKKKTVQVVSVKEEDNRIIYWENQHLHIWGVDANEVVFDVLIKDKAGQFLKDYVLSHSDPWQLNYITTDEVGKKIFSAEASGVVSTAYNSYKTVLWANNKFLNLSNMRESIEIDSSLSEAERQEKLEDLDRLEGVYRIVGLLKVLSPTIKIALTMSGHPVLGFLCDVAAAELIQYIDDNTDVIADFFEYLEEDMFSWAFHWIIDPSGYVYSGVISNRLSGASVTAWMKDADTGEPVLWDASEYDQENPLLTDAEGWFAWDTPEGEWSVVAQLDGYAQKEDVEYFSIPPIRTDVNIEMVPVDAPSVEWTRVEKDHVAIQFDQYLVPETVSSIVLTDEDGNNISYELEYGKEILDESGNPTGEYLHETAADGTVLSDYYVLKFIDGKNLKDGASVTVSIPEGKLTSCNDKTVAPEVYTENTKEALNISAPNTAEIDYGATITVPVTVSPTDANISAVSANEMMVKVLAIKETATEGTYDLELQGHFPGIASVEISGIDSNVSTKIEVTVTTNSTFTGFEDEEDPEEEHAYGDWKVTKEATCTEDGIKEKVCANCGDKVIEAVPATGHKWNSTYSVDKSATYTKQGLKSIHCSVCGTIQEGSTVVIPKLLKPVKMLTISGITAKTYTGSALTQAVVVKDGTKTLKIGTDYTVSYRNNVNSGTASVIIKGKGNYKDSVTKTFTIKKAANTIIAKNFVKTYSASAQTFALGVKVKNGTPTYKSSTKSVTVTKAGKVTIKAKFIGKATITITTPVSKNYNASTKKITITANPAKTEISSVTSPATSKMTVKWKKNAVGTGYQIQYSTSNKFASVKSAWITKNTTINKTITGLAKGKKYYIRLRTYKTVGGVKYYSGWSKAKTVTIKK